MLKLIMLLSLGKVLQLYIGKWGLNRKDPHKKCYFLVRIIRYNYRHTTQVCLHVYVGMSQL